MKTDIAQRTKPFLKWAGGKRRLLPTILPRIAIGEGTYFEPFLGAGAVFLNLDSLVPKIGSDINGELVNVWRCVRNQPDELISALSKFENSRTEYLRVRAWDRASDWPSGYTPIQRASRTIFLNKTCFNGLYRVNSRGQFNVPFGDQSNATVADSKTIQVASSILNRLDVRGARPEILHADYREVVARAKNGDFVYFDPPYIPESKTASFVNYAEKGFSFDDQVELRDIALDLVERGVKVLISNSDTPLARELYKDKSAFSVSVVSISRAIGAASKTRRDTNEILVMGGLRSGNGGIT